MPESAAGYTAWDVLLHELELLIGEEAIHRGLALRDLPENGESGAVLLSDGSRRSADIVIAADGIGSQARQILFPDVRPHYAGYVAWRGTVAETKLSSAVVDLFSDSFTSFERNGTSILTYEIPGENGETEPDHRRLNWVWYENVRDADELTTLLTDNSGVVRRATIGRGLLPGGTIERMRHRARQNLSEPFAQLVTATAEPFVQAIQDMVVPRLVFGRTVLIGDAASVIRPHIGSGTAKAVDDAIKLADALSDESYRAHRCLVAWEHARLADHHALAAQGAAAAGRLGLGWAEGESQWSRRADAALAFAGTW
jgi:2-polyprenyl-6-methoxyphenol hydroxylase-like FAD-dependent oxidoreductase